MNKMEQELIQEKNRIIEAQTEIIGHQSRLNALLKSPPIFVEPKVVKDADEIVEFKLAQMREGAISQYKGSLVEEVEKLRLPLPNKKPYPEKIHIVECLIDDVIAIIKGVK